MAHAPTGSGKTDAFLLPIIFDIQNMKDAEALDGDGNRVRQPALNKGTPYAIVVAVTRDLVIQIKTRAIALTHGECITLCFGKGELLLADDDLLLGTENSTWEESDLLLQKNEQLGMTTSSSK